MTKKLTLINEIVTQLEQEGITLTPNAVRARLKIAMRRLAEESCTALGAEINEEELERVASSRAFQEAVASVLNDDDAP